MQTGLFIGGKWVEGGPPFEVKNKYNGQLLGAVSAARQQDVSAAVGAAQQAAPVMAALPAYARAKILSRTAEKIGAQKEELARLIAAEAGKALKFARLEVERAASVFAVAAEEAKRIHGETVPLDAAPEGENYFGFWRRRPVGVVAAITPFNFPLNLVAHKVAPALSAGNTVVLKPARYTPLSAVRLAEILQEAELPDGALNLIHGPGESTGEWLITDPRVAKISFTGSAAVGRGIIARAGIKKVTLELGNTSPVIVAPDGDLDFAAQRCAVGAFYNSGQVCISVQRIYAAQKSYQPFCERFVKAAEKMVVGDPLDENVDVGPMIDQREAERVEAWVREAKAAGAKALAGDKREKSLFWPTVLADTKPEMKVISQEVFGPVASVIACPDFEEALRLANDTGYGLQAAVFTKDIDRILKAINALDFGGVIINDTPNFRADHMPYGGNRQSGLGREGVRFAIEEMTNIQMVAIRSK